ncbi:MAG: gliding motility-associated C-terminal domain-containing protein [Flavobacteriales bacterium]|nr:gliding motility-associated C-terminal domain-containing protein [Flavobacteriales bacterium]
MISRFSLISFAMLLGLFSLTSESTFSQPAVNGNAVQLSCNCYRLTEAINTQSGSVWNSEQINLQDPFDFQFDVYLGQDVPGMASGADGIAFVLQPVSTLVGATGGGLGYQGIAPSIAVQIDTYDNGPSQSDLGQDHVAIMANGAIDHASADNLAGPVIALVSGMNIEDGQWHVLRVSWNPVTMLMNVYMDGSLRTSYTGDIIANIFAGDPMVFWGFTGSTGGLNNLQQFCFSIIPGLTSNVSEICEGETITFDDESYSALGEVVGWEWDFGNGQSASNQAPGEIEFAQAGTYWVTQTIVDAEGCDASDSIQVTVNPNPMAAFTTTDVCQDQETDFVDQSSVSSGSVSSWSWEFGDGTTATGNNVSNTYASAGTYDVVLQITTDAGCVDSALNSVTVFENPMANATYESNSLDVVFTAALSTGEQAEWIILDSTILGMNPLNYSFPDSGYYDVILVVTNVNGCVDSITYTIYVEGLPEYDMPNVFTPNGDEMNDHFQPFTYSMVEAKMKIFNRWGRPVFKYEGAIPPTDFWGWDGTVNGGPKADEGTYYYTLDLKGLDGSNFSEQGTVTLLR